MKRWSINWKLFAVSMSLAPLVGFGLSWFFQIRFWYAFLATVVAFQIIGWTATWEDERPGGFHNPKTQR